MSTGDATRPILPRLREAMSTRAFWLHAWRAAMLFGLLACATTIARAGDCTVATITVTVTS
jgi:hypothetical protein